MLMQLNFLYLRTNKLVGTVPESWSTLNNVSCCYRALHLLIDAADVRQNMHSLYKLGSLYYVITAASCRTFLTLVDNNL